MKLKQIRLIYLICFHLIFTLFLYSFLTNYVLILPSRLPQKRFLPSIFLILVGLNCFFDALLYFLIYFRFEFNLCDSHLAGSIMPTNFIPDYQTWKPFVGGGRYIVYILLLSSFSLFASALISSSTF